MRFFHFIRNASFVNSSKISGIDRALQKTKKYRESIGYYAALVFVLFALGSAAYNYRNPTESTDISALPSPEPHVAILSQPDPTLSPEPQSRFDAPVQGKIVQGFLSDALIWSDTLDLWQTHSALDISAALGEAVYAAADGVVLESYTDPLYGNTIVIDHGDGALLRYSSLNTLKLVEVGENVHRGDIISAVGTCTIETEVGAHIHLEYYLDGVPADFSGYLDQKNSDNLRD